MKDLTLVQILIAGLIAAYAITVRKSNVAVISTLAFSLAILHAYDHLYSCLLYTSDAADE